MAEQNQVRQYAVEVEYDAEADEQDIRYLESIIKDTFADLSLGKRIKGWSFEPKQTGEDHG